MLKPKLEPKENRKKTERKPKPKFPEPNTTVGGNLHVSRRDSPGILTDSFIFVSIAFSHFFSFQIDIFFFLWLS